MGNSSNGLIMSQARHQAAIHHLEDASFGLYGGVGTLIEKPPHVAATLRRAVAVVRSRALFVAGAGTHPGRKTFLRRECRSGGTDFGNDLVRGIDSQTRHLRQSLDSILVLAEQDRDPLVQFADLLLDQVQLL